MAVTWETLPSCCWIGTTQFSVRDETLRELEDLPVEWEAERSSTNDPWIRTGTIADG